jgi:hypothetical protein
VRYRAIVEEREGPQPEKPQQMFTTNFGQVQDWAEKVLKNRREGECVVRVFQTAESLTCNIWPPKPELPAEKKT